MSASTKRGWIVAASVGAVEALKDQGFCRWNYTIRSLHQHSRNQLKSRSQPKILSSQSSPLLPSLSKKKNHKESEESLRTVMFLSSWGPN